MTFYFIETIKLCRLFELNYDDQKALNNNAQLKMSLKKRANYVSIARVEWQIDLNWFDIKHVTEIQWIKDQEKGK